MRRTLTGTSSMSSSTGARSRPRRSATAASLGRPRGESDIAYYFEYEFPDRETWKAAQEGLVRAAEDAQGLGVPFRLYFAEIE
jgi:hypothetical protein